MVWSQLGRQKKSGLVPVYSLFQLVVKYVLTISDASWGEDPRKGAVLPGGAPYLLQTVCGR